MKRILATILSVMLVATLAISGTVAYLTDDESAVNVMTVGKVNIKLHEDQRILDENGKPTISDTSILESFEDDKNLMPLVKNSDPNDRWGLSTDKNYVDKIVRVENIGESDAWVRIFVAVPAALEEKFTLADSSETTPLHWDLGTGFESLDIMRPEERADFSEYFANEKTRAFDETVTIDGIAYNVYVFTTTKPLPASDKEKDMTGAAMVGFYLDPAVDYNDADTSGFPYYMGDKEKQIKYNLDNDVRIPVYVQAIQAEGFENSELAFANMPSNPWAGNTMLDETLEDQSLTVTSLDALQTALDGGETDVTIKDAIIDENIFNGHYYKDRNIDFINCTFTANMNYMYINDATFTNCTFDTGSANAAVHYDELFGDLVFNNCTFKSGKIQIGANKDMTGTVTFNNCTFAVTDTTSIWAEMGIRVYSPAEFYGCEFNNRVVLAGSNGLPITFESCTMNGGTSVYYVDNTDGIIRGGNLPVVTIK